MASELVPVEQVDRDAAGDLAEQQQGWFSIGGNDIAAIRHGSWDKCNDDLGVIVQSFARHRLAALKAQASRIAELEAGHEQAWRDGFQSARDCLSGGDAFCLTEDVETDAWLDSKTRARALLGDREG